MFGIKKLKEDVRDLKEQNKITRERLWKLENPVPFKKGDKADYRFKYNNSSMEIEGSCVITDVECTPDAYYANWFRWVITGYNEQGDMISSEHYYLTPHKTPEN